MVKPLTVYSYIPRNFSASFYYRIQVPIMTANELGMTVRARIDTNDAGIDPETRVRTFCEADIVHLYQPVGDATYHNARIARSFLPSKKDDGWKWPPSLIVDSDDNIFNVNPYNSAYRALGIRDHEGRDLPIGHTIGAMENGERRILWKDGENGFDIARNRQTVQTYRNLIELADAVTCSTPHVAECVKNDATTRRVRVFPNLVRFNDYEQLDLPEPAKRLNILWQGGSSHYEDWYPLRAVLGRITRRYKHVHWIIWGQLYPWVMDHIPADRYTYVNWCPYQEYKLRLVMQNHQINLAPLHDDRFNRCRSAIKFYEATVLKRPVPTLAQATGPYQDEIQEGETGLLFKTPAEFETQLSRLVEDETLRRTLASNAKDWVSQHRDAHKHVPKQIAFWEELRETAQREMPHMPERDWEKFLAQIEAEEKAQEAATEAVEA